MNNEANKIIYKKCYIDVITPINIASDKKLTAIDYIYDYKNSLAYILNPILWHKFIYSKKLLAKYEDYLSNGMNINLYNWLHNEGYSIKDIEDCVLYKLKVALTNKNLNAKTLNNIILQTKLSDGKVYIPASSIKGFIRSAIMYRWLEKNPQKKEQYCKGLIFDRINTIKRANREIKESLEAGHKMALMHGIKISDTYTKDNINLILLQKLDLVVDKNNYFSEKPLSVYRECIEPKSRYFFDLQINTNLTKYLGIYSSEDLIICIEDFYKAINNILKTDFTRARTRVFDEVDKGNIYLGGGVGFYSKTIVGNIVSQQTKRVEVVNAILNHTFKSRYKEQSKFIAPKTLKLVDYKNEKHLMGIAKIGLL